MGFRGAIFDVDGVLVDSPHERAWREALQELMEHEWSDIRGQTTYSPDRFTPAIYHAVMAGKPRAAGAQAALEYFGVDVSGLSEPARGSVLGGGEPVGEVQVPRLG